MKRIFYLFALIFSISCSSDSENAVDYTEKNETDIAEYIKKNNLTVKKTSSGLYYTITKDVDGEKKPTSSSNVTVDYKGYFLDGKVFDKSATGATKFNLNQLISGFSEGIRLLTVGDEATLIIPSKLAYGNKKVSSIPAGSVLIFDVKLISIN